MQKGGLRTRGITKTSTPGHPLITVVTVVFNGAATLEQTILSVVNQTYDNVEYIIVDGASTDGTLDIVRKYEDKIDYWQSEPDGGIYDAMNKGIGFATGDYIAMLNSGDSYIEKILEKIAEIIKTHNGYILYGVIKCFENEVFTRVDGRSAEFLPMGMLPHPSAFMPMGLHKKYGRYDTSFKIAADYDFFLKMFVHKEPFFFTDLIIANFDCGGISNTSKLVFEECEAIRKRYGCYEKLCFKKRFVIFLKRILKW